MGGPGDDRGIADRGADRAEAREAERDARLAAIAALGSVRTALSTGSLVGDEVGVLLRHVESQVRRFEEAPGPLTRQVIAGDLLESYRVLRDRELKAPRGQRRELLKEISSIGGPKLLVPWTQAQPARLEDVAAEGSTRTFFSAFNLERFYEAVKYQAPRAPAPARGGRPQRSRPPSGPVDSTEVHAYNLTLVRGRGRAAKRVTLPWPLAPLVVPNAYKIDLVKAKGMSFLSREGRIQLVAYLLQVLGDTSESGEVWSRDEGKFMKPVDLATFIVETASLNVGALRFEGPESAFKVFEHAQPGYATTFLVTDEMIDILHFYVDLEPKFRPRDRSHDKRDKLKGCASIEWLTELLREVPHAHKLLWIQDQMIQGANVIYPDNLKPGMVVPAQYFLTEKVAESLGGEEHNVLFIGSQTANDSIIMTEDGRVWLVKERERNLQAFCQAVMDLQGLLTLSFILCTALGAVLGGPLVSFLITSGDVAIQINEAGGIRAFVKELKNNPGKAALFMLDLVTMTLDVKGMRGLLMNPTQTLEATIQTVEAGVKSGRALPGAVEGLDRAAAGERRAADGVKAVEGEAQAAKDARAGALGAEPNAPRGDPAAGARAQRATDGPHSTDARPTTDARGARRAPEPPPAPSNAPKPPKQPKDVEIEIADAARDTKAAKEGAAAKDAGAAQQAAAAKEAEESAAKAAAEAKEIEEALDLRRNLKSKPRKDPPPKPTRAERRQPKGGREELLAPGAKQPGVHPVRAIARPAERAGGLAAQANAERRLREFVGRNEKAAEAAKKLDRLKCGELALDVAEEFASARRQGRKLLQKIAELPEAEIQGLAAARRALLKEPVVLKLRDATSQMDWLDLLRIPKAGRSDLLTLVARIEPAVDSGLSRALARAMASGEFALQGGLGQFHAAAHLLDEYGAMGVRMVMEEPVHHAKLGLREVDIRATLGNGLQLDIEVKTYLGPLTIYDHVRGQIVKDLALHAKGGWENLRYLFSPNVREDLHVFRRAIQDAFGTLEVRKAVKAAQMDEAVAFQKLLDRLDDTMNPLVDVYLFAVLP